MKRSPSEIVPFEDRSGLSTKERLRRVTDDFFASLKPITVAGYRQDLMEFAKFTGTKDPNDAAQKLFASQPWVANDLCIRWKAAMTEKKNAPATINRRLSAVRSLLRYGRVLGLVTWGIDVRGVRAAKYKNTAGPGIDVVGQMLAAAGEQKSGFRAARDVALIRLVVAVGLRNVELRELDIEHLDFVNSRIAVRGKGKTERESITVPKDALLALKRWLELRGYEAGPLFTTVSRVKGDRRLTRVEVWRTIRSLGAKVGVKVWPHGLRHTAITEALNVTDGNIRAAQKFSRHSKPETLMLYDDSRLDVAGEIAAMVEEKLKGGKT